MDKNKFQLLSKVSMLLKLLPNSIKHEIKSQHKVHNLSQSNYIIFVIMIYNNNI